LFSNNNNFVVIKCRLPAEQVPFAASRRHDQLNKRRIMAQLERLRIESRVKIKIAFVKTNWWKCNKQTMDGFASNV